MNYTSNAFLRTLDPQVFEDAAERIRQGDNEYSCNAVTYAAIGDGSQSDQGEINPHLLAYKAFFEPKTEAEKKAHPFWNKGLRMFWQDNTPERSLRRYKRERIMALAMMHSLVTLAKKR